MAIDTTEFESDTARYRSGTTARLSGVPVETLRVWERRYSVVGPQLSETGQRLYSASDVRRLRIIKQLVDHGHAIGSIATLATESLIAMSDAESRMGARPDLGAATRTSDVEVALVGPWLASRRMSELLSHSTLKVVGKCAELNRAAHELADSQADLVVMEIQILNATTIATVDAIKNACNATRGIIFYRFAPSPILRALRAAGYDVLRKPLESVEVEWFCKALMRAPASQDKSATLAPASAAPPPPRFDEAGLLAFAETGSSIYCECPRHLVDLVLSLSSFELYSAACANRDAADAALHRDLQWTTGHARAALESALLRLAQAEGIALPSGADYIS